MKLNLMDRNRDGQESDHVEAKEESKWFRINQTGF